MEQIPDPVSKENDKAQDPCPHGLGTGEFSETKMSGGQ